VTRRNYDFKAPWNIIQWKGVHNYFSSQCIYICISYIQISQNRSTNSGVSHSSSFYYLWSNYPLTCKHLKICCSTTWDVWEFLLRKQFHSSKDNISFSLNVSCIEVPLSSRPITEILINFRLHCSLQYVTSSPLVLSLMKLQYDSEHGIKKIMTLVPSSTLIYSITTTLHPYYFFNKMYISTWKKNSAFVAELYSVNLLYIHSY
jgi:hypothetical protein